VEMHGAASQTSRYVWQWTVHERFGLPKGNGLSKGRRLMTLVAAARARLKYQPGASTLLSFGLKQTFFGFFCHSNLLVQTAEVGKCKEC
jgi:hypothetical protein